jgi:hypothetical protein
VLRELVRQRSALVNQVRGLLHGWGLPPTGYSTHGSSSVHLILEEINTRLCAGPVGHDASGL